MAKSKVLWMVMAAALLCVGGGTFIMACGDEKPATAPAKTDGAVAKAEAWAVPSPCASSTPTAVSGRSASSPRTAPLSRSGGG